MGEIINCVSFVKLTVFGEMFELSVTRERAVLVHIEITLMRSFKMDVKPNQGLEHGPNEHENFPLSFHSRCVF